MRAPRPATRECAFTAAPPTARPTSFVDYPYHPCVVTCNPYYPIYSCNYRNVFVCVHVRMRTFHPGVVATKVRYFGVKSTKVPLGADGTKPAKVSHRPSWPTKAAILDDRAAWPHLRYFCLHCSRPSRPVFGPVLACFAAPPVRAPRAGRLAH